MNARVKRYSILAISLFFFGISLGVVIWIAHDEKIRLAEREHVALEAAAAATKAEQELTVNKKMSEATQGIFQDIETILAGLSDDDLPRED